MPAVLNFSLPLGVASATGNKYGLTEIAHNFVKKIVSCECPRKKSERCRKFVRMTNLLIKALKNKTRLNVDRLGSILRQGALKLDCLCDKVKKLRNPLCFYSINQNSVENLNIILGACTYQRPVPYRFVIQSKDIRIFSKVDEGSYGEIYAIKRKKQELRILKIIPTLAAPQVSVEEMNFRDHATVEVVCSRYLSTLTKSAEFHAPNFPYMHSVHLVTGQPPEFLKQAWKIYESDPNTVTDKCKPDKYVRDSLFLVMELEYCGNPFFEQDIIHIPQAESIILQTISSLAVAEEAYRFEHRDLHSGNLLYKRTPEECIWYRGRHFKWHVRSHNVKAFIIDFSMSRIDTGGKALALNISSLEYEHHSEIDIANYNDAYMLMKKEISDDYTEFTPRSNLIWIKHLLEILFYRLCHQLVNSDEKIEENDVLIMNLIRKLKCNILHYDTTMGFLQSEVFEMRHEELRPSSKSTTSHL